MYKLLVTLGPSSFEKKIVTQIEKENIYLFRINLSHTPIDLIEEIIDKIQHVTKVPICLDSEGAQIRTQFVANDEILFNREDEVKIHFNEVLGDSNNISFSPVNIARQLNVGDEIKIDFNSVEIKVVEKKGNYCIANVISGGKIGSNKAVDVNRSLELEPITHKDKKAIEIGEKMGIRNYALSFAGSSKDVKMMRELTGKDTNIISKIESKKSLFNLSDIIDASNEILIDRGDLSREVEIEKIPFMQRRIISLGRSKNVPVHVATNLLESMTNGPQPTRAEINDVVSTLLMGANGLVLAAETAVGKYPIESVKMIRKLIKQLGMWTQNTSIEELLANNL